MKFQTSVFTSAILVASAAALDLSDIRDTFSIKQKAIYHTVTSKYENGS